jgi:acyl dehydratase
MNPNTPAIELVFSKPPSNRKAMVGSLMARRPALAPANRLGLRFHAVWTGAQADPSAVRAYMALCDGDGAAAPVCVPAAPAPYYTFALPMLYVHAMAMPLHMAILTHPKFPLRLLGLVHWANQTEMLQPMAPGAQMDFECTLDGITESERGQMFDIHTTVRVGGEMVWREISTFLAPAKRGKTGGGRKPEGTNTAAEPTWGAAQAQWAVAANAGRRFAGPSGDWNPIHVSAFTARLFGYPRAIAHGLFSAARCLALLQAGKPQTFPVRLDLRFKRPLLIPGDVALHTAAQDGATLFVLKVQPGGEPHIEGRLQCGSSEVD